MERSPYLLMSDKVYNNCYEKINLRQIRDGHKELCREIFGEIPPPDYDIIGDNEARCHFCGQVIVFNMLDQHMRHHEVRRRRSL